MELSVEDTKYDSYLDYLNKNEEALFHIREWVDIMRDEPEEWIKLSEVYHSLRRMLGDE